VRESLDALVRKGALEEPVETGGGGRRVAVLGRLEKVFEPLSRRGVGEERSD
jgi:hypothetical protein